MTAITCGVVLAPRRLVAVVLGPRGEARRYPCRAYRGAPYGLVQYLAAVGAEIVVADTLGRVDSVMRRAADAGLVAWAAHDALVTAISAPLMTLDGAIARALQGVETPLFVSASESPRRERHTDAVRGADRSLAS